MSVDFSTLSSLLHLEGREYLYLGIFYALSCVISSFLITLYVLKDKQLVAFIKKSIFSLQFLLSCVICLFAFLFCVWLYGYGEYAWFMAIVLLTLFVLSYIDSVLLAIPDWLNFALLFFIFVGLYYFDLLSLEHFIASFGICGAFALLRIFGSFIFKKEIMGEADLVVLASMGALLNLVSSLYLVLITSILAMIYIVLVGITHLKGKQIALSTIKVPFVLFLSLGFVITLFYLRYPLWGEMSV